jgi:hypothetical protein
VWVRDNLKQTFEIPMSEEEIQIRRFLRLKQYGQYPNSRGTLPIPHPNSTRSSNKVLDKLNLPWLSHYEFMLESG